MVVPVRTPGGPLFQEDLSDDQDLPHLCMASPFYVDTGH